MLQYLLRQGVAPSNVLLHGHSLGGAVAALLRQRQPGPIIVDRSFSSLPAVPVATAARVGLPEIVARGPVRVCPCLLFLLLLFFLSLRDIWFYVSQICYSPHSEPLRRLRSKSPHFWHESR